MSWLNNSLNTIKGQLTTLAHEVLAETAGPGDEEYRLPVERNTEKTTIELLSETQKRKEELHTLCIEQEAEIAKLRKQIADFKIQKFGSVTGDSFNTATAADRASKSPIENNAPLEESWCWELDKTDKPEHEHSSEESSGGNSSEMVNITLEESTTSKSTRRTQRKIPVENAGQQKRLQQLEMENKELNTALEELDSQHNLAMQNVLELKTELQAKLNTITKEYENLKKKQVDQFISSELEQAKVKKQLESLEEALNSSKMDNQRMQERIDKDTVELQKTIVEMANLQSLLEKKNQDNIELLQRIKDANEEVDKASLERETLNSRLFEMSKEVEELKKNVKEKKTSECSSSTSKQSEDEFIVVRETDAISSGPTTPPTKEELKDKIVQLENRVSELTLENGSLLLRVQERESENEMVKQALESKLQKLTLNYQELQLNVRAETEKLDSSSSELEQKIKSLTLENESLRAEFDSISQAKFHQVIEEEKHKITDLDADEDEEQLTFEKLLELMENYIKSEMGEACKGKFERGYCALRDRLHTIENLEKRLSQMSEEIIELRDSKLVWDHEKKTLEADISQYIIQCDELMKNNEILLNELENLKRNKLETIPEHNEENILQLELQLDEVNKLNRTLEQEYVELTEKCEELDREKQMLTEQFRASQQLIGDLKNSEKDYQLQLETLELEKSNMAFELDEFKSKDSKESNDEKHNSLELKCQDLEGQLARLSKDQADLVNAIQAQKASLVESNRKREDTERKLQVQEIAARNLEENFILKQEEHKHEIQANQIILDSLKTEILTLRNQLEEADSLKATNRVLEQKLLENQEFLERLEIELQDKSTKEDNLQSEINELQKAQEYVEGTEVIKNELEILQKEHEKLLRQNENQNDELASLREKIFTNADEESAENYKKRIEELEFEIAEAKFLKAAFDTLTNEKNEMIKALHQKHNENVQYYNEIQRLLGVVEQLETEKLKQTSEGPCERCPSLKSTIDELGREQEKMKDQINFLKEKSDILTTNLLTEQTNQKLVRQEKSEVEERNAAIQKDLERLREHLLEIEDIHTQETIEMQKELEEAKANMISLHEEVLKSSTAYTSASIRANQQAETLQAQYALLVQQRDELVAKLSSAEDREQKNQAALCNLQCALEQFQNDKEQDIKVATLRIRKDLQLELDKEAQLQSEISNLQQQINEANQGLMAAARLSDQLEFCQQTIADLRDEIEAMKQKNSTLEDKLKMSESNQADKIEKSLIKSLLIGYVVSHNQNDKTQVLRMISSVLDFTQSESDKVGLNKQQTGWLAAILGSGSSTDTQGQHSKDNLIQAFVKFLEQESQPKDNGNNLPNLLNITQIAVGTSNQATRRISADNSISDNSSSGINTSNSNIAPTPLPIQPMLINSNVLNEFVPTRNSSSILKDILSDS